jgi:hypothetical protein
MSAVPEALAQALGAATRIEAYLIEKGASTTARADARKVVMVLNHAVQRFGNRRGSGRATRARGRASYGMTKSRGR